jgi:cysteine desulfurase
MRAYFDHNATTPLEPAVLDAMLPFLRENFGNASSIHTAGQRARAAVERARAQVAGLIGADPDEIVFTSGGTESDNLGILGACTALPRQRRHIITSCIEHHAVLHACRALEKSDDPYEVTFLPVSTDGFVSADSLRAALRPNTALVTIMHANNEIGTIQPVAELAAIAHEAGAVFHTDAVQSTGKVAVTVRALGVDLLSLSAHKFYGPKGVGALYVRRGVQIKPLMHGGHNFGEVRPGTENVAGIVGLGAAAELARLEMASDAQNTVRSRTLFEDAVPHAFPDGVCIPNFPTSGACASARIPNTSNFSFQGVDGEALVIALDLAGYACSSGSACSSGTVEPSHVLLALGRSSQMARGGLRVSFGRHNTQTEVDGLIRATIDCVERLRALSPEVIATAH